MLGFYLVGAALATELPAGATLTERALELVNDHYLHPESFSTSDAFAGAAEALERAIPWLIVEERDRDVVLFHGTRGAIATLRVDGAHVLDLVPALAKLETVIEGAGEPLPPKLDLEIEMLKGITTALDTHSTILTDERLARFDERITGKLTGIGGTLGRDPGGELVIRDVYPGGPAAYARLQPGDQIVRIDGTSTIGMTVAQATERIRGPADSAVTLTVRDALADMLQDVSLVRAEVVVPNVTWRKLASGAGLVRIDHFSEQTVALVREAIQALATERATGFVIDLRGNAGGSMLQSAECADLFLERGALLRTVGRSGRKVANLQAYLQAEPQGIEPDLPVVVLLDGGSASASEILAGDLVLLDRAVIVGARSYGKGSVQKVYTLEDGEAGGRGVLLKLTVAEYRLAGDTPVTEAGLTPDLALDAAIFDGDGIDLPVRSGADAVLTVDERPGWRGAESGVDGGAGRDDAALHAAERVIAAAEGAHRADLLFAVERVRDEIRREQDERFVATMALRGIDWSAAPVSTRPPMAAIRLVIADPPVAGRTVELRAFVDNRGSVEVVRGVVRLSSHGGPWDGVELPIGRVAAGETGMGKALVRLPTTDGDREDLVTATLSCDGCASMSPRVDTVLTVTGAERPAIAVTARWLAERQQVELTLANEAGGALTGLRPRFAFRDAAHGIELVDRDATVEALPSGGRATVDLGVRLAADAAGPIALDLVVESDQFSSAFAHRFALKLPLDGTPVRVEGPTLASTVPSSLPTGEHPIELRAADDGGVASLTVWCDGEKIAWHPGGAQRVESRVPLRIGEAGPHLLTIDLLDVDGIERVLRYPIRGADEDGAAAAP
jgi:carboxyl-terminal processing protease